MLWHGSEKTNDNHQCILVMQLSPDENISSSTSLLWTYPPLLYLQCLPLCQWLLYNPLKKKKTKQPSFNSIGKVFKECSILTIFRCSLPIYSSVQTHTSWLLLRTLHSNCPQTVHRLPSSQTQQIFSKPFLMGHLHYICPCWPSRILETLPLSWPQVTAFPFLCFQLWPSVSFMNVLCIFSLNTGLFSVS